MPTQAVLQPNLGLYLDRPALAVPPRALSDGFNFRIKLGTVDTRNLGWTKLTENWTLDGPVTLIDNFFPRDQDEKVIFGTPTDLYLWDTSGDTVSYLNPIYATGTAAASGTAVTGTGTAWDTDDNVTGGDFISFGANDEQDPGATWFEILTVDSDTGITLVDDAGTVVDGPYTIRRVFHSSDTDFWDFDTFVEDGASGDDLWFATNNADWVVTWNGSDATVTSQSGLGFKCATLTNFGNMMLYGDITDGGVRFPTSIINSDVGFPLAAGDLGTGLSEQFRVHGGTDNIVNMVPLGDSLAIYSYRNITVAQFVGDPLVFIFRSVADGLGPVSNNAIADFGDFHEFIGSDAQYSFDGVSISEIGSHLWREVLRTADPLRRVRIFGHFDEEQGDLIWSIPLNTDDTVGDPTGAAEIAYSEHYLEDPGDGIPTPYSKRYFPFTITGFYMQAEGKTWADMVETWSEINYSWDDQFLQASFPLNLAGDASGQVYILHTSQLGDGVTLPNWAKFGRVALGSGRERSLLRRVYSFIRDAAETIYVRVYMSDHASVNGSPSDDLPFGPVSGDTGHFVSPFRRGRFAEVQIGSPEGHGWICEGYDYDFILGGTR